MWRRRPPGKGRQATCGPPFTGGRGLQVPGKPAASLGNATVHPQNISARICFILFFSISPSILYHFHLSWPQAGMPEDGKRSTANYLVTSVLKKYFRKFVSTTFIRTVLCMRLGVSISPNFCFSYFQIFQLFRTISFVSQLSSPIFHIGLLWKFINIEIR